MYRGRVSPNAALGCCLPPSPARCQAGDHPEPPHSSTNYTCSGLVAPQTAAPAFTSSALIFTSPLKIRT